MSRSKSLYSILTIGGLCTLLAGISALRPVAAWADETSEKQGAAIMDKYVEATGGKAAYDGIKTRMIRSEVTLPGGGERGTMEVYTQAPNKFRATIGTVMGPMERGSDGEVVWVQPPHDEPRILEGAARVSVIRSITQDRFGQWRKSYRKADYIGDEDLDGTKCAKVVLTHIPLDAQVEESPVTVLVARDTGLIVMWTSEMKEQRPTESGAPVDVQVLVTAHLGNYRKEGSILVPHSMRVVYSVGEGDEAMTQESSVTVKEMKFNQEIPAEKFVLPEAVQKQLKAGETNKK
jgi:outer membrane lipoprotein-sorting protein